MLREILESVKSDEWDLVKHGGKDVLYTNFQEPKSQGETSLEISFSNGVFLLEKIDGSGNKQVKIKDFRKFQSEIDKIVQSKVAMPECPLLMTLVLK